MDLATIGGLILGTALLLWGIMSNSDLSAFTDVPSVVIVIGGAVSALLVAVPMHRIKAVVSVFKKTIMYKSVSAEQLIKDLVSYAEVARRDGILSLESMTKDIEDDFIVRGIQMAVDGTDPELIEQIMNSDLENLMERHEIGKSIFDILGKYAPAFGMIGTLIGLVAMLQNMDDPSSIGAGMAVALLTTLYGAVASNLIFLPLADRLAKRSSDEVLLKTIIVRGVMSIQSGDNPRIVEQKLLTFLPPDERPVPEEDEAA